MTLSRIIILLIMMCLCTHVEAKNRGEKHTRAKKIYRISQSSRHPVKKIPKVSTIKGKQKLVVEINRILKDLDPHASIGLYIKSMKRGQVLYVKNESKPLIPASIIKILTAEAAILYLGPQYKFPTTLVTDASKIKNGVINGNLYLVQSGDPSLTYYDLTDLMVTLKSQQIQTVAGNVYIDNSAYDQDNFGPGWLANYLAYCYAAPINASIINRNCLSFKISPATLPGRLANIIQSPNFYYGKIENNIITKKTHSACYVSLSHNSQQTITATGCIPKGSIVWGVNSVIKDLMGYNQSLLKNLFARYGIKVMGKFEAGVAKPKLPVVATHYSKPLYMLVNDLLKKSDNVIAGSLLKKMGQFHSKKAGSWHNGSLAIKNILAQKLRLDVGGLKIVDGSGLSRHNQVKPMHIMQVLDYAYHHYETNHHFVSALPISGLDGTLKNRLRNVAKKVRAKTGTIAGVVSLAGYALNKDKEAIGFVVIINGPNGYVWKYRDIEDKIVTALTKYTA